MFNKSSNNYKNEGPQQQQHLCWVETYVQQVIPHPVRMEGERSNARPQKAAIDKLPLMA